MTMFVCPRCGAISYNPHDVENRYCGRCHAFVEDTLMVPFQRCHCGSKRFVAGPRGGSSQNVTCVECSARFNLLIPPLPGPFLLIDELSRSTGKPAELRGAAYIIEILP